jgi:diacylglycerol kinase family enzyme
MGVYAKIVQSADYRDAKVQTVAAMLPDLLGPAARPLDLRYTLPSGQEVVAAQLLLVSNNPYQMAQLRGGGTRERIDLGVLGVVSVRVETAADVEKLAALELAGNVRRFASWNDWTASEFEVRSAGPVDIGVDGEALTLQPPLHFVIRPGALTVRLPRTAPRRSPAARAVRVVAKPTLVALWHIVLGRPTGVR